MTDYPELYLSIAGERIGIGHRAVHEVVNPATGAVIGRLPLADAADLDRALDAAADGFRRWRTAPPQERANVLLGAAKLLTERADAIARVATMEQGKTLAEARGETLYIANLFSFYAGECQRLYGRALVRPAGQRSTVWHEPVGPVAAFAPWNFPVLNPGRKLGAPIAAGCSIILKAAEETPASALAVVQALHDAGLPPGVAQAVFGVPDAVSRHLLGSPVIRKLSFTGSTMVGKHLVKLAADDMKRTTMELGGHAPVLVFADADIDRAIDVMSAAKARNCGQVCVSPTRYIVEEAVFPRFLDGFTERMGAVKVGDGLAYGTQMGPLANPRRPDAMERMVADARGHGAWVAAGGERIGNQGFFYAPTVLAEVPLDAEIMNEEPFGPVAILNPAKDEAAMIAEANRLPYGLASYVWTRDAGRQRAIVHAIEAGMVAVNMAAVSAPDAPFGGVKWSGHGSEDGREGVEACLVTKTVHES